MADVKKRAKVGRDGFSAHGIEYDHRYKEIKVKKNDYYDQNEMHVLLLRWKEARAELIKNGHTPTTAKEHMPTLLRDLLWSVADGYMHSIPEGMFKLKYCMDVEGNRLTTDLWEQLRIDAFEHLIHTAAYYTPEKVPEEGVELKTNKGEPRRPYIRCYFFFLMVLRQITKCNLGKYYSQFGNTGIKRSTNEFYEAMYGSKAFDNGGRKVGISAHTDEERDFIENVAEEYDEADGDCFE